MRLTPFALVFESIAQESFPKIRAAATSGGIDLLDRDAFLLIPDVLALLRELRSDEGVGEAMDQLAALLHHAYVLWDTGNLTLAISREQLAELAAQPSAIPAGPREAPRPYYAQFPERGIWAQVVPGTPAEPLDGCFIHLTPQGELRVLGVFGFRPERMGFSVVEAAGIRPEGLRRRDGSPLFSSTLSGGAAAGVYSLTGSEELLELGWRTRTFQAEPAETR
jgi:hypothetical protein